MKEKWRARIPGGSLLLMMLTAAAASTQNEARAQGSAVGIFEGHGDVGAVLQAGTSEYDSVKHSYALTGSGENMWSNSDNFQFAWKKWAVDGSLTVDVAFVARGGNAHRKAVLMIRQSLDADSVYVDVALHGDGLTSLQYREAKGAPMKFSPISQRLRNCASRSVVITFLCGWVIVEKN